MQKISYVYIATNFPRCTVLYTGVTSKLSKRSGQHQDKFFPGSFSARYNINRIVYIEIFNDIHSAIDREKQIKSWSRERKYDLIKKANPAYDDMTDDAVYDGIATRPEPHTS